MSRLFPDPIVAARARLLPRAAHRHGMPMREHNAVGLLPGGDAILDAMLTLLRGAARDLRFEMYGWSDDAVGREVMEAFLGALKRGVAVRGLVDAVGSWDAGAMVAELRAAGADIRWFHPVAPWRPRLWNPRDHRKLLIADGAEVVVGSANWGLDYRPAQNRHAFLDLGREGIPRREIVDVLLDEHVAAADEGRILGADDRRLDGRRSGRILGPVNEAGEIAIVEIAEAMDLVLGRDGAVQAGHDLTRELEAEVHPLGPDVEQDVAGSRDGSAWSAPDLLEPV